MVQDEGKPTSGELLQLVKEKGGLSASELTKLEAIFYQPAEETPAYIELLLQELDKLQPGPTSGLAVRLDTFRKSLIDGNSIKCAERAAMLSGYLGSPLVYAIVIGISLALFIFAAWLFITLKSFWWFISLLLSMLSTGIIVIYPSLYTEKYSLRIADRLSKSGIGTLLAQGPDAVLRIYDHTSVPWRMLLGPQPKSLRGVALLLARCLPWFMNPTERYFPTGRLARFLSLLLASTPILVQFFFFDLMAVPSTNFHIGVFAVTCLFFVTGIYYVRLQNLMYDVMKFELVRYLKEQFSSFRVEQQAGD